MDAAIVTAHVAEVAWTLAAEAMSRRGLVEDDWMIEGRKSGPL